MVVNLYMGRDASGRYNIMGQIQVRFFFKNK